MSNIMGEKSTLTLFFGGGEWNPLLFWQLWQKKKKNTLALGTVYFLQLQVKHAGMYM